LNSPLRLTLNRARVQVISVPNRSVSLPALSRATSREPPLAFGVKSHSYCTFSTILRSTPLGC
jgi:hypothetical protein